MITPDESLQAREVLEAIYFLQKTIRYITPIVRYSLSHEFGSPNNRKFRERDFDNFKKEKDRFNIFNLTPNREVAATFYPGILLERGWWARDPKTKNEINKVEFDENQGLQNWLYYGFEQWAPSWDINPELIRKVDESFLVGQMTDDDEANSATILMNGMIAQKMRNEVLQELKDKNIYAVNIKAKGTVFKLSQLPEKYRQLLHQSPDRYNPFDKYFVVDNEHRGSFDLINKGIPERYTGYMWLCLCPKKCLRLGFPPSLKDVYFVWEHTDYTKPDAWKYNRDSLFYKRDYIENLVKSDKDSEGIVLLQRSSSLVEYEKPLYSTEEFRKYVLGIDK